VYKNSNIQKTREGIFSPRRDQSGEVDKQLGITKAGNELLRRLLVQCAQYILGAFGSDCDLRRFGEKIASRGGSGAKKKATIAVARKLGVLMHHFWATGEEYDPFYNTNKKKRKKVSEHNRLRRNPVACDFQAQG
jgi:transposase